MDAGQSKDDGESSGWEKGCPGTEPEYEAGDNFAMGQDSDHRQLRVRPGQRQGSDDCEGKPPEQPRPNRHDPNRMYSSECCQREDGGTKGGDEGGPASAH